MSEDYSRSVGNTNAVQQMVLMDIDAVVKSMGKDITSFGLPKLDMTDDFNVYHATTLIKNLTIVVLLFLVYFIYKSICCMLLS